MLLRGMSGVVIRALTMVSPFIAATSLLHVCAIAPQNRLPAASRDIGPDIARLLSLPERALWYRSAALSNVPRPT